MYVTIETVTDSLGDGWAGEFDESLAVMMSNAWLDGKRLPHFETIPATVLKAGALIARAVAKGEMYQGRTEGVVVSKSSKAGDVSISKTYADGANGQAMSADEQMALALIAPFLKSGIGGTLRVERA